MNTRQNRSEKAPALRIKITPQRSEGGLDRLVELARYELDQDPYRGMQSPGSPWGTCQIVEQVQEESPSAATAKVFYTCHCTCPSLIQWTEELHAEKKKRKNKRKRNKPPPGSENVLGHRPTDPEFRCACDYNPLCLGSLGGVMDELLERAAKRVQEEEEDLDDSTQSQASQNEVIEIDTSSFASSSVQEREPKRSKPSPPLEISYASDDASPVELGKHKPSNVYREELQAEHMLLDPEKDDAIYGTVTTEEMKQVRKISLVDTGPVKSYVEETILSLLDNGAAMPYARYMEELRKWHDSLSFSNPLLTRDPANGSDKLAIAIPPGIKNLGATCYLNTQFQCLARIPAFLSGLFSWTEPEEKHQMNSVISSMQLLFARMAHGSEATVTTQEFSEALGLENDEMQDPNEFGRLLLERIHESFQTCSTGQGDKDLSQLLPRLFHGVTSYETSCMTCHNTTERSEGFMDLNLPIVNPHKEASKATSGQQKLTDTFGATTDTNVQYCLDDYVCAEDLSGDNQYSCEVCQEKRDARRRVTFQELPPILNVQLSRYVFDRKTYAKKKLTDKVLLPRVLLVPKKGTEATARYLLCAVMKHRGSSAYTGHYIAEAMDWESGTWFEFNDETVKVLEAPSCSYMPEELDTLDKKKVKGSQDAYNMYYVEEGFLARCASKSLTARAETEQTAVLAKVANERENRFSMLTEMCLNDGKVAHRLLRRRVGLSSKLSSELSSPAGGILFNSRGSNVSESPPPVWVDGEILRRFLSCDKAELGSVVTSSGPLLHHRHLLCEHETGLHPRNARRGKLLPRPLYDALVSLMLGERRMLNGEEEEDGPTGHSDEDSVNDCIITPDQNMYCEICAESYKAELRQKMNCLCRLRQLSDELNPKAKKIEIADDSSADETEENESVYLVSTKFIQKFRALVNGILKAADATELQSKGRKQGNKKAEVYCEGLDSIDLSALDGSSSSSELDYFVNSAITCEHSNCGSCNGKTVKKVSGDVWTLVLSLFPNAICHKVQKNAAYKDLRCELCDDEQAHEEIFAEKLRKWTKDATNSHLLKDIAKRKQTFEELEDAMLYVNDHEENSKPFHGGDSDDHFLVHREDVDSWREAVKAVKKHTGKSTSALTESLVGKVFSGVQKDQGAVRMDPSLDVYSHILQSFSSLVCEDHRLPLKRVVCKQGSNLEEPCVSHAGNFVEAFNPFEYAAFIGSVYELGVLLASNSTGQDPTEAGESELQKSPRHVTSEHLQRLQQARHPRLKDGLVAISNDKLSQINGERPDYSLLYKRHYTQGVCHVKGCNEKFNKEQEGRKKYADEAAKSKTNVVDLVDDVDDGTTGSTFSLRAFQIGQGEEFDAAVASILGLPRSDSNSAATDRAYGSLRRSTRKRKVTFPNGPILREDSIDIHPHYNIAAVRLHLYEKYPGFPLDRALTLVVPRASEDENVAPVNDVVDMTVEEAPPNPPDKQRYISFELSHEWNEKPVEDAVEAAVEGSDIVPKSLLQKHLRSEIFLCWNEQSSNNGKKGGKKSKEEDDSSMPNDVLMGMLLEMSNASVDDTPSAKKKKSTRRAERGFQGTLLHSTAPSNSDKAKKTDETGSDKSSEEKQETNQDEDGDVVMSIADNDQESDEEVLKHYQNAAAIESTQNVVVLDESDDDCPAGTKHKSDDEPLSVLVATKQQERQLRSSISSPMEEEIVKSLIGSVASETGMSSLIRSQCREAARFAINEQGAEHSTVEELTSRALAKFFDSQTF